MVEITVDLKKPRDDSYTIYIGSEALEHLVHRFRDHRNVDRYVVISDSLVAPLHGEQVTERIRRSAKPVNVISIPAGEASKSMATVLEVVARLIGLNATRETCLVALGGGVVGDLTGFVASIFKRGVGYVQIPTSLIAQVDSSVGGKTGVDVPEGKNLLGTFHHPQAVFIDPAFLSTLPQEEFQNGLSEVLKYAMISDVGLFELMTDRAADILSRQADLVQSIIERSCRTKADVVERDEQEGGLRRILNFGHTVGHAVEALSDYAWSHGEAVAAGMVAATAISRRLGHLDAAQGERITALIGRYGLPTTIPEDFGSEQILAFMARDKKVSQEQLHFVLLKGIARPFVTPDVPPDVVRQALAELRR